MEQTNGLDAQPSRLVANVVQLLEAARAELERDREAAKASITQASLIPQPELERREVPSKANSSTGELAGWQVRRLRAHVDTHLAETIRVSDLSRIVQRSTAHFCRAFKRTFGQTPHAYIVAQRLERAKSLILESGEPLCAIAVLSGFSDQAHLSKVFREHVGETPGAWRRRKFDDRKLATLSYGEAGARL